MAILCKEIKGECISETYVDFQKLMVNESDPTLWLFRQRNTEPSAMTLRATVFARYRTLSSLVTKYGINDLKISWKNWVHSVLLSGAPTKMVKGDASRKSKMLYITSGEAGVSTSG